MTVETLEGDREIIEKALDEYGRVVTGEITPEQYTDDRLLLIELKSELRTALFFRISGPFMLTLHKRH